MRRIKSFLLTLLWALSAYVSYLIVCGLFGYARDMSRITGETGHFFAVGLGSCMILSVLFSPVIILIERNNAKKGHMEVYDEKRRSS